MRFSRKLYQHGYAGGEIEAAQIHCEPYDRANFRQALDEIRGLTTQAPEIFVPCMQELCAKAGVAIVFVPALPKPA